jgi:hypothetical protein
MAMTANERAKEFDRAICSLEMELTLRPNTEAGRKVLGEVLVALWALRVEQVDESERMLH